jgi:hypothetical protein
VVKRFLLSQLVPLIVQACSRDMSLTDGLDGVQPPISLVSGLEQRGDVDVGVVPSL